MLALVAVLSVAVGCGGGGGVGVTPPALCIGFAADVPGTPAASTVVAKQGLGTTCGQVEVLVRLTGVNDVFTVSFDVAFNPLKVAYEGYSIAGSELSSDGASLQVLETPGTGSVSLGVSRVNPATGLNITGTGTVIKLLFSAVSNSVPDTASFAFSSTQVLGSETPPVEKTGISWSGGQFVID